MRGRIFSALYVLVRLCLLIAFAVGPFLSGGLDGLSQDLFGDRRVEGFGGDVVLSPGAYEWIHNPVLRRGYRWLVPPLLKSPPGRWIVDTVRTR